jgi:hypothetical protein
MGWFVAFPPSRNRGARMGHPAPSADEDLFVGGAYSREAWIGGCSLR